MLAKYVTCSANTQENFLWNVIMLINELIKCWIFSLFFRNSSKKKKLSMSKLAMVTKFPHVSIWKRRRTKGTRNEWRNSTTSKLMCPQLRLECDESILMETSALFLHHFSCCVTNMVLYWILCLLKNWLLRCKQLIIYSALSIRCNFSIFLKIIQSCQIRYA